jgi:hypothetical protein
VDIGPLWKQAPSPVLGIESLPTTHRDDALGTRPSEVGGSVPALTDSSDRGENALMPAATLALGELPARGIFSADLRNLGADLDEASGGLMGLFAESGACIGAGAEGAFSFSLPFTEF